MTFSFNGGAGPENLFQMLSLQIHETAFLVIEVRIYPLQQSSLQPYEQMTELLFALEKLKIKYDIVTVPFEFQRGSNKMLLLRRINRS